MADVLPRVLLVDDACSLAGGGGPEVDASPSDELRDTVMTATGSSSDMVEARDESHARDGEAVVEKAVERIRFLLTCLFFITFKHFSVSITTTKRV